LQQKDFDISEQVLRVLNRTEKKRATDKKTAERRSQRKKKKMH
jgi:hypothetical protein